MFQDETDGPQRLYVKYISNVPLFKLAMKVDYFSHPIGSNDFFGLTEHIIRVMSHPFHVYMIEGYIFL